MAETKGKTDTGLYVRKKLFRKKKVPITGVSDDLPDFSSKAKSHKKKDPKDVSIGNYTDKDLDIWADLIKRKICTYEGIASVYQVSVGTLHKRVKSGIGKGTLGPKRKLPEDLEHKMLDYLRFRNQSCDPILKFYFKKEVDEYLINKDLLHYFSGHLPSNGWMDSFAEFYRKQFVFATQKEVSETCRKQFSDISGWVKERDEAIRQMMGHLPMSDLSVAFLDLLTLESQTNPKITFDIIFAFNAAGKVFTPLVLDGYGVDPNFKILYKERLGFTKRCAGLIQKDAIVNLLKEIERHIIIRQGGFPWLLYVMPSLHKELTFLLWESLEELDVKYLKIPPCIEKAMRFNCTSLHSRINDKFQCTVQKRYSAERYTPLHFLRALADAFDNLKVSLVIRSQVRCLRVLNGVPKPDTKVDKRKVPPGAKKWINRKKITQARAIKQIINASSSSDSS